MDRNSMKKSLAAMASYGHCRDARLVGATILGGCSVEQLPPEAASAGWRDGLNETETDGSSAFELILGDEPDASVLEDAVTLMASIPASGGAFSDERIVIEYLGLGEVVSAPEVLSAPEDVPVLSDDERAALVEQDSTSTSFIGINLVTRNQFKVTVPRELITDLAPVTEPSIEGFDGGPGDFGGNGEDEALGIAGSNELKLAAPTSDDGNSAGDLALSSNPSSPPPGWSANQDNRQRIYGLNAPVDGVQRWQVQLGTGCSGSLVGPRHVATAAHCLFRFSDGSWFDDYNARAGANGNTSNASVFVDANNVPAGQTVWKWVPAGYIATGQREFDFGVLVTPATLGGSGPGQAGCFEGQCWFEHATYSDSLTSSYALWRRGYAACDPTPNPLPNARIDEPCQNGGMWDAFQTCVAKPCNPNHLFGVDSSCNAADFSNADGAGWNRILHHGCDASAADSGSPLYHKHSTFGWLILSVQSSQECGSTSLCPAAPANVLARPLIDVRLTPEYRGWITHFRTLFP